MAHQNQLDLRTNKGIKDRDRRTPGKAPNVLNSMVFQAFHKGFGAVDLIFSGRFGLGFFGFFLGHF